MRVPINKLPPMNVVMFFEAGFGNTKLLPQRNCVFGCFRRFDCKPPNVARYKPTVPILMLNIDSKRINAIVKF